MYYTENSFKPEWQCVGEENGLGEVEYRLANTQRQESALACPPARVTFEPRCSRPASVALCPQSSRTLSRTFAVLCYREHKRCFHFWCPTLLHFLCDGQLKVMLNGCNASRKTENSKERKTRSLSGWRKNKVEWTGAERSTESLEKLRQSLERNL